MLTKFTQTILFLLFATIANAQISQNMTLVGNWNPGGFPTSGSLMYNDVWGYADCAGNEYAIMGGAAYFHFIDITNPANPIEVASILGGNTTTWRDMKTYSKYAYGVCDSCNEGLSVFDLGDLPNSVTMVGQYTTSFTRAHNIYIDEDNARLYAVGTNTQGGGVIVFDLAANPANPPEIARMNLTGGYIHDMMVRGNVGYAHSGNNGMYVYDFTNLSSVVTLGSFTGYTPSGYNHAGWPTDDLQGYVFADETHNRDLKYCDISDLSNISITSLFRSALLAPANTGSIAHNPFIRDNYAIVSYYHDGLQVFDISDPNNIVQTAWYDTYPGNTNYSGYSGNWGAYPFLPSGNILASDEFTGLYILNPTNITFSPITPPPPPTVSIVANGATNFCTGGSVVLSSTYSGNTVQWYQNGTPITGATSDNFTATAAGDYYAQTTNSACSANSSTITISISPDPDATLNVGNFNEICEGESLQITAPAGEPIYNWTLNGSPLSQNSNTILVNQAGNYQVEISNGSCTSTSIVANLTVQTNPDATLNVSGNQEICEGDVLILSVAAGANLYQWTKDNAPFSGNTNTITISQSGDYQVTAINNNCNDASEIITVTTVAYPDVTLNDFGPIQLCNNQSTILTIPPGAGSYTWYKDGNIVVGTSNIINVFEDGIYHVEAANGNCMAFSQTVTVEVGQDPNVALNVPNQNTLCDGDILEIAVATGADSYTWYYNNALQNSATNNNFFALNAGTYYVVAEINGCTATSQTTEVILQQYPDANLNAPNLNEICEGEDFILSAPNGAQNYQWYRNNTLLATASNTVIVDEPGDYYLVASNGDCESISQTITLVVQPTPDVTLNTSGTVEICEGQPLTLTVPAGAQSYTWMLNGNQSTGSTNSINISQSGTYQVIAQNGNCAATSENVTVNIRQYPTTDWNVPLQNEICDSSSIDLNIPSGADTYQWFLNGNSLNNATNSFTATQSGNYQVVAANGSCETISDMVNLTVNVTPDVALNLPNVNQICEGESVTLTIATGASDYQWFENGNLISNNTNTITVNTAGMYEVMASNGTCAATSETVEIAVNSYPETTLNLPLQNEICAGETIEMTVPAGAQTYLWFQNGNLLSQNGNTITISQSGDYQVIAMNENCAATSEMVNVQVTTYPNVDLSMPLQNQICEGETLPISVSTGAATYQWFLDGNPIGNTADILATEAGNYTVTAANGNCTITSEIVELSVLTYPDINLDGETTNNLCAGESVEISIATGAQTYQWFQNGDLLPQNTNSITISNSGNYQVVAANGNCADISEMVNVTVFDYPEASIDVPLQNDLCEGENLTITLPAGAQDYEWFQNGELMNEMGLTLTVSQAGDYYAVAANGECATTSQTVQVNVTPLPNIELSVGSMNQICEGDQLTIENMGNADGYQWFQDGELLPISGNALTVSESGNYQLIVTNGECAVNSEIINVAVVNAPDSGLNVGTNNEICEGETLLLEVTAGASNYQWFLNGEMTGNNEPTLSATTAGEYFVMIGSGDCSSVSSTINLEIIPLPNPQLSAAGEQSICQGETFNVSVPNNADNYQWYFNDAPIGNNTFQFSTMEAGEYYVISENAGCSVTSELIFLTVNPFPNADVQTTAVQLCPGETAVLSTPSQGQSYQWFLNGSPISSANNTSLTISDGGTYSLSVTQAGCTAVSVNLFIEIFTPIVPEITFDSEILTSTPAGSYQWLLNGDPIAGAIDQTFVPTENGDYAVQIIDNNGCEATSEPLNVLINAVQDIALANEFLLFPNPAKNELFLENQSEDLLNGQLVIFNNLGIELFEINMDFANHFTQKIDIKHWSAGVYYLKITATDGRFFVKRFVKE